MRRWSTYDCVATRCVSGEAPDGILSAAATPVSSCRFDRFKSSGQCSKTVEDIAQAFFHGDVDIDKSRRKFRPHRQRPRSRWKEGCRIARPRGTSRSRRKQRRRPSLHTRGCLRGKKAGRAFVYYRGDILSLSDAGWTRSPIGKSSLAMSLGEGFPVGQDWQAGKSEEKDGQN